MIDPADWEREIDDVVRAVRERGKGAVVVGDHWFANYFRRQGFETDFISNETDHRHRKKRIPTWWHPSRWIFRARSC